MVKKKFILIAGFVLSVFAVATEASALMTVGFNHTFPVSINMHEVIIITDATAGMFIIIR